MSAFSFVATTKKLTLSGKAKLIFGQALAEGNVADFIFTGSGLVHLSGAVSKYLTYHFIGNHSDTTKILMSSTVYKVLEKTNQQVISKVLRVFQKIQLNVITAGSK